MTLRVSLIGSSSSATTKPGFRPDEFLEIERNFLTKGVVQGVGGAFAVTENGTPNMSVNVASGRALIEIQNTNVSGSPTYKAWFHNDATINKAIAAADATNPRKDRVVLRIDVSTDPNAASSNVAIVEVLTGTPAGSPSAPAEPSNAITLAIIDVPASDTTIGTAQITDSRSYVQAGSSVLQDLARASQVASIRSNADFFATTTGSSNAYAATYANLPTLATGLRVYAKANHSNTGAATFNYNSGGAVAIKKLGGTTDVISGDIPSGMLMELEYDGTYWQLLSYPGQQPTLPTYLFESRKTTSDDSAAFATSGTAENDCPASHQYPISANDWAAGCQYVFEVHGYVERGNSGTTATVRLKIGSVTIDTLTFNNGANTVGTFRWRGKLTCRTPGASAVVETLFDSFYKDGAASQVNTFNVGGGSGSVTSVTVDTTASQALKVSVQFSAATSTTATIRHLDVHKVNAA